MFNYKNTAIHYTDTGKGNAVVLVHGFLEDASMWQKTAKELAKRYRVITVDLLGHGKSECYGYIHTMEDQADMLFALISHLRLRKISIVGHSMGGYVALAFAELYPDNVRSLVLLNASAQADSEERKINRGRAIEVVKKNSDAFIQMATRNLFDDKAHKKFKKEIAVFTTQALQTPVQGIIAALEGMKTRMDREALLHFGPYPKLMIASENDTIIPIKDIKEQVENTDVSLEIVPGGHVSTIEQFQKVLDILSAFLKKNG
ncbi:alpha/beta fold hydrolase [Paenimyroides aestuarii]|uniref:Alpha/beta hydrolase n=1 Tax=Paenimyroides aestuarii TaxID=2968490 RepID=A0ABY5NTG1_9FLAO|nr:alpha/beta hydrolase [Paenimyroides aestuarii]UUV21871.1 alpha/beta hydrolase [Paenimyroides aestuarii]